ncbi:DUF1641 domain-containing protein [Bacillus infantis]|uniref:DUF1641 domain-containing protein n=1 Tax=Bacillus infantis TaxID=324767 RepID=UPI001CD38B68|nr:DUF1641 domain-containing protein [Bacillus infantis]MCA1041131.1 DUF1641 domain-containing protein [Bacillus infantis]MCR6613426.1 DUF1641 domain-containing protein [Bacillus infantis]
MAKPISVIQKTELTEEQLKQQSLENLLSGIVENKDSLLETLALLQELHDSGILDAAGSLLKAKEKAAHAAIGQLTREPVTNMINNAMAAGGILTQLNPETTAKLSKSLMAGMKKAEQGLKEDSKIGVFDLMKALKDPDINRVLGFGFNLLKGMGEGLKE